MSKRSPLPSSRRSSSNDNRNASSGKSKNKSNSIVKVSSREPSPSSDNKKIISNISPKSDSYQQVGFKQINKTPVKQSFSSLKTIISNKNFQLNSEMAKVCLIVIDGWGISDQKEGNAILNSDTPVMDDLSKVQGKYLTLDASGESVGLPAGLMGNSEVGHLNIGAGRIMYQDILRINKDCRSGDIANNGYFVEACRRAINNRGRLHLLGLVSDGGVHGHIEHLFAILEAAKRLGVPNVYVHFLADGRDTPPKSGINYIKQLANKLNELKYGTISSVIGRYYAMDRDKRWERIKIAYDCLVDGVGDKVVVVDGDYTNLFKKIEERYDSGQTDEFLTPIITNNEGLIKDDDTLIFFNFRADRMRQITETLGIKLNFEVKKKLNNIGIFTMNQYKKEFPFKMLYPPVKPINVLAECISKAKVGQFHCAETEKYAHVTFFFNGGREAEFEGEDRMMVPSPKVATYDLDPKMNAAGVAYEMCKAIQTNKYQFVMCNLAPPDMVGHTGKYEPTLIACQVTDEAIGKIKEACEKNDYILLITADHGNAEKMVDDNGGPVTSHTTNRVPFIMNNTNKSFITISHNAALCDVAPTVLSLMNIPKPAEMDGQSLIS